jgi:hypothetical protein
MDEISLSLPRRAAESYRRVWLVLPGDSRGADLGLEAAWLESRSESKTSWLFAQDDFQSLIYLFELPAFLEN